MIHGAYHIVSESTEDRFDEVESLAEALLVARGLALEGRAGDPVLIEHDGRVIHQFVLTAEGIVEEGPVR